MNQQPIKIAVFGLGGVGGYYGAMLALHAAATDGLLEVSWIARGAHLEAIRAAGGLRVVTPSRDFLARSTCVTDNPAEVGTVDYILFCTKDYDMERGVAEIRPMIGQNTKILPLLNGADIAERMRTYLPDTVVWKGCVYISARKSAPGLITLEADRELFYFGSGLPEQTDNEVCLAELLTAAGIRAYNPTDIDWYIMKKFMMISVTATATAYFNKPIGSVLTEHEPELLSLLEEVAELFRTKYGQVPDDVVQQLLDKQRKMPPESTSSMHSDFLRGGSTEVETLTGYVVREAEALRVDLPMYKRMYRELVSRTAN
ncbi:2-dehydropantoate 2-reductase [Porphyromonas gingivalis]|uniref:2-dehydropantoate 2-reductase n=1 Tax=Porphyromonas gingivalis TaxID=837 RepID=UPI001B8B1877|nr:2-dehydropantoate 2-reductase [Porphyromonas gingivalis]